MQIIEEISSFVNLKDVGICSKQEYFSLQN